MLTEHRARARSRVGILSKKAKQQPDDPDVLEELRQARRDYAAVAIEDHIKALVATAPRLTRDQAEKLSLLLRDAAA